VLKLLPIVMDAVCYNVVLIMHRKCNEYNLSVRLHTTLLLLYKTHMGTM
jgi:hypothetical protein